MENIFKGKAEQNWRDIQKDKVDMKRNRDPIIEDKEPDDEVAEDKGSIAPINILNSKIPQNYNNFNKDEDIVKCSFGRDSTMLPNTDKEDYGSKTCEINDNKISSMKIENTRILQDNNNCSAAVAIVNNRRGDEENDENDIDTSTDDVHLDIALVDDDSIDNSDGQDDENNNSESGYSSDNIDSGYGSDNSDGDMGENKSYCSGSSKGYDGDVDTNYDSSSAGSSICVDIDGIDANDKDEKIYERRVNGNCRCKSFIVIRMMIILIMVGVIIYYIKQ